MPYQEDWLKILVKLKASIISVVKHGQSPQKIGYVAKLFQEFVEDNKALLRNDPCATSVVYALHRCMLYPMPENWEQLMDKIDQAVDAILPVEPSVATAVAAPVVLAESPENNSQDDVKQLYVMFAKAIDEANGSSKAKKEAKQLLKQFLKHPLISTIAGDISEILVASS